MVQTVCVVVGDSDRKQLASIAADRNRSHKHIQRALIVLRSSEALTVAEVARQAGVSRPTCQSALNSFQVTGVRPCGWTVWTI
jgi:AraC-like DNA-binding protein